MDAVESHPWLLAELTLCHLHLRCKAPAPGRERAEVLGIHCPAAERGLCLLLHRYRERAPVEETEGTAAAP